MNSIELLAKNQLVLFKEIEKIQKQLDTQSSLIIELINRALEKLEI